MTSPRKFSEKIALLQQKQAAGDEAFNSILHEVETVKQQKTDRKFAPRAKLDVPKRKYEANNGMSHCSNHSIKMENNPEFDRLALPPEHLAWRRTYSDSSLHQTMMANGNTHPHFSHDDHNQPFNVDMKLQPPPPPYGAHHFSMTNSQYEQSPHFDLNNNSYVNDRSDFFHQSGAHESSFQHPQFGTCFTNGTANSNVLMLPPHQYPRTGGSLPDLRLDDGFYSDSSSFSPVSKPHHNSNGELYMTDPQQPQAPSQVGPVKQTSNMRRRHSPIGDIKSRRHSPSPDCSPKQPNHHRMEPQSPQSQSSYSPQNSPLLLTSPAHEPSSYSPQHSNENSQHYFNLPNNFDQITLENNFYLSQQPSPPPSSQQTHHPTIPASLNYYPPFVDNLPSSYQYSPNPNANVKSPTIPDIIFTDVDSSKADLPTDFSNSFDNFMSDADFHLTTEDLMLNDVDLTSDINMSDSNFRSER